jgi:tRNA wybutosine-synthesizing protein 3
MVDNFIIDKEKQLTKSDRSNIGEWDKPIVSLCNKINKKKNYYTTSSCSGRVVLLKYSDKKMENAFLYRTHSKVSFKELKKALEDSVKSYDGIIEFQQTSCILHVACKTLFDAQEIVNKAKESGWKRSGIMGGSRNMVELHSTEQMSFPIAKGRKILVEDEFLRLVVDIANSKLGRVWDKIDRLKKLI